MLMMFDVIYMITKHIVNYAKAKAKKILKNKKMCDFF